MVIDLILIVILIILGIICFIGLFYKHISEAKKLNNKMLMSSLIIVLLIIFLGAGTIYLNNVNNASGIGNLFVLEKKHPTSFKEIVIKNLNGKPVLYDNINQEEINYLTNDNSQHRLKNYYPVYINDLDYYYLVVFSKNIVANYDHGYFFQADYEFYDGADSLLVISKDNGRFIDYDKYSNIGKMIDLKRSQAVDDMICLPILMPHEDRIENIQALLIREVLISNYLRVVSYNALHMHSFNDYINYPSNFIEKYAASSNKSILALNNQKEIKYFTILADYDDDVGQSSASFSLEDNSELFNNMIYVKQGYFTTQNDKIYYVSNDLKLYYIVGKSSFIVANIDILDNWMEFIPKL